MYPWRGSFIDLRKLTAFRPTRLHCIKFVFRFFIAIWPIVLRAEQQSLQNYFVVLSGFKEVNLDHVCFSDRALKISIQPELIIVIFWRCYKGLKILGWPTYGEKIMYI